MIRYLKFFGLLFFLIGCKPELPDYVIPPEKMEKVLLDMHLVEGHISTMNSSDSAMIAAASYYNGVYEKFNIDSAKYAVSMSYYYKHPETFSVLLDSVKAKLEVLKKAQDIKEQQESKLALDKLILKNNDYLKVKVDSTKLKFNFDVFPFRYLGTSEE